MNANGISKDDDPKPKWDYPFFLIFDKKKGLATKDAILDVPYKKQIGPGPMEIEFCSPVKRAAIFIIAFFWIPKKNENRF